MMTVMVPLDGSPFAERAIPVAVAIARRTGARLQLVRVRVSLPFSFDDDSESYLRATAAQLDSQLTGGVTVSVLTDDLGGLIYPPPAPDTVAGVLANHARSHADLIVMSSHGRGGVQRAWLGSVADGLLRIAPRPLFLVRPGAPSVSTAAAADRGIRHILVPLDGSETAEHAIPSAREFARAFHARITLLRVTSPLALQLSSDPADGYPLADLTSPGRRAALDYINDVAAKLREDGFAAEAHVIEDMSAGPAIVDYARSNDVDLVTLTTTGAGSIRRLLLGSVADHVIRRSEAPVLVCNTKHLAAPPGEDSLAVVTRADLEC